MNYLKKKKISNPTRLSKVKKCYEEAMKREVKKH